MSDSRDPATPRSTARGFGRGRVPWDSENSGDGGHERVSRGALWASQTCAISPNCAQRTGVHNACASPRFHRCLPEHGGPAIVHGDGPLLVVSLREHPSLMGECTRRVGTARNRRIAIHSDGIDTLPTGSADRLTAATASAGLPWPPASSLRSKLVPDGGGPWQHVTRRSGRFGPAG